MKRQKEKNIKDRRKEFNIRCNICNKALTDKEVNWNEELKTYEPCTECLDAAMDAAYSDGFQAEDDDPFVVLEDTPQDQYDVFNLLFSSDKTKDERIYDE